MTERKVEKSEEQWREELTEFEYHVLREAGTERAFTGELLNEERTGTYSCRGCGAELFTSTTKFDSHCGWPSFYEPKEDHAVELREDNSHGMKRTEIRSNRADSHLGHVFDDVERREFTGDLADEIGRGIRRRRHRHGDLRAGATLAERVHGQRGEDPTDPPARCPYPHPAVSHEPRLQQLSDDFARRGLKPFHTPAGTLMPEQAKDEIGLAAALACHSWHPVSRALVSAAHAGFHPSRAVHSAKPQPHRHLQRHIQLNCRFGLFKISIILGKAANCFG